MKKLVVSIDKISDQHFPGWVECSLIDAYGKKHMFNEKIRVVSDCDGLLSKNLPVEGSIRCTLSAISPGGPDAMVVVDTLQPDGVETIDGVSEFTVKYDQVVD